jgi:hypothetical protein
MAFRAALPTLLSQALIAFTIEFDNEFEHRIEHHTGNQGGPGVWLTSMAMWSNFMRLIPGDGVALATVQANGRITNLAGLQPYPDGWRATRNPYRARTQAMLADPASALPRYPMVLGRGGYPDGS